MSSMPWSLISLSTQASKLVSKLSVMAIMLLLTFAGCKKDDDTQPNSTLSAQAGADQTVAVGQIAELDGSASKDSEGKALIYQWVLTKKPTGSNAALVNPTKAKASFIVDLAGTYEAELTVSTTHGQAKDKVFITATQGTSAQTISGPITSDRTLTNLIADPTLADYKVMSNVDVNAKLTIEPGVVIEFEQDKSLTINISGALIAKGTASLPIVFTGKNKSKAFWRGIVLYSNSLLNELDHVVVEHAGSSNIPGIPLELKANVALLSTSNSSSALKISNTAFTNGGGFGLFVHGNSELTDFSKNTFENNLGSAVYVPARQVHKLDASSHFKGNNGYNGVQIGGSLKESLEVTWPLFIDGASYYASNDLDIESGLRLAEGITIEYNPGIVMRITGEGYLKASGTAGKLIIFTARLKTENDYWGGLVFESASIHNKLEYTEISYAGNKDLTGFHETRANVAVSSSGKLSIEHSLIKNGLGWGIAALTDLGSVINESVVTSNTFEGLVKGKTKLTSTDDIPTTPLHGEWLDHWTFSRNYSMNPTFYDRATGTWFNGASNPWSMNPATGFGISIEENGNFVWTIAEYGPPAGCGNPYSAEYITGQVTKNGNSLTFGQSYWRSKFYNPCDETQNVDTDVETGSLQLSYEIYRETNTQGQEYWVLKLINPDNTSFLYYRR